MVYNSKMWEPVSNWERQFCRPAASLLYQKPILYTSLAGLGLGYVAVPATTTRWRKRHVNNQWEHPLLYQRLLLPAPESSSSFLTSLCHENQYFMAQVAALGTSE